MEGCNHLIEGAYRAPRGDHDGCTKDRVLRKEEYGRSRRVPFGGLPKGRLQKAIECERKEVAGCRRKPECIDMMGKKRLSVSSRHENRTPEDDTVLGDVRVCH